MTLNELIEKAISLRDKDPDLGDRLVEIYNAGFSLEEDEIVSIQSIATSSAVQGVLIRVDNGL